MAFSFSLQVVMKVAVMIILATAAMVKAAGVPPPQGYQHRHGGGREEYNMTLYAHVPVHNAPNGEVLVAGVNGTASNVSAFGTTYVLDGLVTLGSTRNTTAVGRMQGTYFFTAVASYNLHVSLSIIFNNHRFNGSSIEILGTENPQLAVRSAPVVGGTGVFRSATGIVDISTVVIDPKSHYTLKLHFDFDTPKFRRT